MTRLSLVRSADDGEHLVVVSESGEEFELALTDDLRRAVALTRPRPSVGSTDPAEEPDRASTSLSPKQIQQRIRSGLNAHELAELTGEPYEALHRYEPPVLAERAYIADLARGTRIGRDSGAPVLADLVADRLASRGVDPEAVTWDAWREVDEPWLVAVDFSVDGRNVRALWEFDHTARAVTAQDDESRWLTETELLDVPIPRRHLSAVRPEQDDVPLDKSRPLMPVPSESDNSAADGSAKQDDDNSAPSSTELLLADLEERRGTRDSVDAEMDEDVDDDGGFEGFGPAQRKREAEVGFTQPPKAGRTMPHPAGSARRESSSGEGGDGAATPDDKSEAPSAESLPSAPEPKPSRRGRSSVPSWDEIVFGAKND
ncbi:septation protein SepH [Demequina sp. SO4-13]|uniref:septation protein SepH n=1 Tax=Demequina sp. SO4-13 TaxID=3401027 RepID=UPI003AF9AB7E